MDVDPGMVDCRAQLTGVEWEAEEKKAEWEGVEKEEA
jgi:hypothetical protein